MSTAARSNFRPTVFSSPQTITLTSTLALLETPGPGVDRGARGGADDLGRRAIVELQRLQRNSGVTASITGLTIANGYTTSGGGGVSNDGDLTLADDTTDRELGIRWRRSLERWLALLYQ